jgi:hypothetical protein
LLVLTYALFQAKFSTEKKKGKINLKELHVSPVDCSASKIEMNSMVEDTDTEEEKFFRDRYANELKKKKQDSRGDELDDERRKVKQQGMKTPGRRGEQIKHEEIDREISRRYSVGREKKADEKSNS